jgi:hypothetical protein
MFVLVLSSLLFLPALASAQATLTGVVQDPSGGVLPGVTVEASSPALIEKVRTAVTDGNGRFQIIDLRPGLYRVTFSLAGFSTVVRDGVELTGSAVVRVDADLRVGTVQETVTVTGEAPTVDVQTVTRQQVLSNEMIDALPTARNYVTLARLIPGTQGGGNDVGGSELQGTGGSVTIHGSRNVDQRVTLNGINTMTLQAGGNVGGQIPDVGSAQEITVDSSGLSAEMATGGVRINFIPRDGGNTFANSTFFTFSNGGLQGSNFTQRLKDAGLGTPNAVKQNWDLNESFGGPIRRDRVWFWFSTRYNEVANYAPVFVNKNAFDATKWLYEPDTSQRGINKGYSFNNSLRMTWQATPRNKIAGTYKVDRWCQCPNFISATRAPEAGYDRRFPRLRQEHLEWTSPVTNKLLLEAVGPAPLRALGQHAAAEARLARRSDRSCRDTVAHFGAGAVKRVGLPGGRHRPGPEHARFQQHPGAELRLPRRDVLRDRHAQLQGGLQPDARLPAPGNLQLPAVPVPLQQRHPEPGDDVRDAVHGAQQSGQRPGPLRSGPVADESAHAQPGAALRLLWHQLPGTACRTGTARAHTQPDLPGSEEPCVARPHVSHRRGVRSAR